MVTDFKKCCEDLLRKSKKGAGKMKAIAYIVLIIISVGCGTLVSNIKDRSIRVGLTTMFVSLALNLLAQKIGII